MENLELKEKQIQLSELKTQITNAPEYLQGQKNNSILLCNEIMNMEKRRDSLVSEIKSMEIFDATKKIISSEIHNEEQY